MDLMTTTLERPRPHFDGDLRSEFTLAKLALGRRMYASGLDDGMLGAEIAAVDEAIGRATNEDAKALRLGRVHLLIQLAEAALVDDAPLPGADVEYRAAVAARQALRNALRAGVHYAVSEPRW